MNHEGDVMSLINFGTLLPPVVSECDALQSFDKFCLQWEPKDFFTRKSFVENDPRKKIWQMAVKRIHFKRLVKILFVRIRVELDSDAMDTDIDAELES